MALYFKLQRFFKNAGSSRIYEVPGLIPRFFSTALKPNKLCKLSTNNVHSKRTFFKIFRKKTPEKLKVLDNIPEAYQLIYRNGMNKYILFAQVFTTATFVCVIILTAIYSKDLKVDTGNIGDSLNDEQNLYIAILALLWTMLYIMVQRMPIRIYSLTQQEKYIFVFYGNIPFTVRRLTCFSKDIIKLEESGVLPWKDNRYEIEKQQRVIMLDNFFRRPADLNIMLGYQNPPKDYD